ncbi:DUF3501 family protein [Candidatus Neomarinimicrobiota bacterium]
MEKLTLADLMNIYEYEKDRDKYRRSIIKYKSERRIQLGPYILITFENRKTMKYQVQEMMRAERMVDDVKIQHELDIYNALLPDQNELSATLFIEITEETEIRELLYKFIGLTENQTLFIKMDHDKVYANFESGREEEDKISSVHYIRFRFTHEQISRMQSGKTKLSIGIDYKDYQYDRIFSRMEIKNIFSDLIPD